MDIGRLRYCRLLGRSVESGMCRHGASDDDVGQRCLEITLVVDIGRDGGGHS
jgi:hypothetical protein